MSRLKSSLVGAGLVACATLLVATVGLWVRSYVIWEKVSHTSFAMIAPGRPGGDPTGGWWTCRLTTIWALASRGVLTIGVDEYDSLGPDEEPLRAQWAGTRGWSYETFNAGLTALPRPWIRWDPPRSVSVVDVGYTHVMRQGIDTHLVTIPAWLIAALLASPLVLWACSVRRRIRRAQGGRCPGCGYDRRGLGMQVPCPECARPSG